MLTDIVFCHCSRDRRAIQSTESRFLTYSRGVLTVHQFHIPHHININSPVFQIVPGISLSVGREGLFATIKLIPSMAQAPTH